MQSDPTQALSGLRVIEFTAGMAGPWIGRFMAHCGAEVIKVESTKRPDVTRLFIPPRDPDGRVHPQASPWFTDWNAGKRFISLDLTNPHAPQLAKQLVSQADIVIENYATGVMEKLGLDTESLRQAKPDLIQFRTNGYGHSGPDRHHIAWGPNIEATSGLAHLSGFPDRTCTMTQYAYPDPASALHGLFVILCALEHRRNTGEGQVISLAQVETTMSCFGNTLMEQLANGHPPAKLGNQSLWDSPQSCYPCLGEDRWCAITIANQEQWNRLCELIGQSDWAHDPRFENASERRHHSDLIDAAITAWTASRDVFEVMKTLQAAEIAAGVVQTTEDQFKRDPHLAERNYFEEIPHKTKGTVTATGIPLGLTSTPGRTTNSGAAVGRDNAYVFKEIVGLSEEEFLRLEQAGAIESPEPETTV
ncbi:MAG: CoA transferase [Deltaproteobacteria bacterium]|nr:CoA transferase [Deltaproteobacteria bacterium]